MLNKVFDIRIFKGRLVIVPLRELDADDFTAVKEVAESNTYSYIMKLNGGGDGSENWEFHKDGKFYVGYYKVRFTLQEELNKRIEEMQKEHKTTLDNMERGYLDSICSVYGETRNGTTGKFKNQYEFEDKTKEEVDTDAIYKEASNNINKEYLFRQQVYVGG